MTMTVKDLLTKDLVWNKEPVVIDFNGDKSPLDRLEFQTEFIEEDDYVVVFIEPLYHQNTDTPYLRIMVERIK